jgi:hypothetical protein
VGGVPAGGRPARYHFRGMSPWPRFGAHSLALTAREPRGRAVEQGAEHGARTQVPRPLKRGFAA